MTFLVFMVSDVAVAVTGNGVSGAEGGAGSGGRGSFCYCGKCNEVCTMEEKGKDTEKKNKTYIDTPQHHYHHHNHYHHNHHHTTKRNNNKSNN